MRIDAKDFRVTPELSSLQHLHYAWNRHALILIFQGMDGGGKDGAIRPVMSWVTWKAAKSQFQAAKRRRVATLPHLFRPSTTSRRRRKNNWKSAN